MDTNINNEILGEMAKAGVMYGHKKTKTHPKMKPFLGGRKNEIELLDPESTLKTLSTAVEFLKDKKKNGGLVLCVGTKPAQKQAIQIFAEQFNFPYVVVRWLGGTLTNFKVIRERFLYYYNLKSKLEKGELAKYTKKEQLDFSNQVKKMSQFFDGLTNLTRIPDALLIIDIEEHDTAVREAKRIGAPIVALVDSNDNPETVDFPIIANDHAKLSIDWILQKISEDLKLEGVIVNNANEERVIANNAN